MDHTNACGRYRHIVFTLNNYSEDEYLNILNSEYFKYVIIGKEICPTTGTPHLQGYGELERQRRIKSIKKMNARMHFERRFGTQQQAIAYCKKDGNYQEKGEMNCQGERIDLIALKEKAMQNVSVRQLLQYHDEVSLNHLKTFQAYKSFIKPEKIKPAVTWIYGPTGSGDPTNSQLLQ